MIMKAIEYTNKLGTNILRLIYSTCTNDLVIQSKQASVIEDFLFAFCIEFNRIFIADSLLMNLLEKHLIVKTKVYLNNTKTLCKNNLVMNKNVVADFFNGTNNYYILNKLRIFEKSNA